MAFYNEAWFHHGVSDNVTQLAQQMRSVTTGTVRTREGVKGKTEPFNRIGAVDMPPVVSRDADTQYANPPQSKRRAPLHDYAIAVLFDTFDDLKMLPNAQSEHAQILTYSRNRRMDDVVIAALGGTATVVDEAGETTSTQAVANTIVHGGTGMTMAKLRNATRVLNAADVMADDRTLLLSPVAVEDLLADSTVTSADFSSLNLLSTGTFAMDAKWMGCNVRVSTRLPLTGNVRTCYMYQKLAMGLAIAQFSEVEIDKAVHKWNAMQAILKLSAGSVRVDEAGVVPIELDESV